MRQIKTDTPNAAQVFYKMVVFRMPDRLKTDFRVALMKQELDIQHTLEAFAEQFIAYCEGNKNPDPMKTIIKRAETLSRGV